MDGSFRLRGVVDADLVSRVFADMQELFALPEEEKRQCLRRDFSAGYTPAGNEGVRDLPKDEYRSFWDILSPGENRFPDGFDACAIESLYVDVKRLVVAAFVQRYPDLDEIIVDGMHGLRVTHFRARAPDWIVMPCHQDLGLFTGFVGGSGRGLEGKSGDAWEVVENLVGDILVGAGTALRLYDPDVIPFKHRVVSTGECRISLAFFLEPREDVRLPGGEQAGERLRRIVTRIRNTDPV